ncbi:lycopene beta-cyclase CrtY [Devosia sp.]|uniref:lycopene beta-cyclase CrtY n=1 Tax=Devosia sp. TaxID=1871048 RepID=UPI003A9012FC
MSTRLLIAGAGLWAALIAQRVTHAHPDAEIVILEGSQRPFGEHTWSFHDTDIGAGDWAWIEELVAKRWPAQSVSFPTRQRHFDTGYASLSSDRVLEVIEKAPRIEIMRGARVTALEATGAVLDDGQRIAADCVIDARGFAPHPALVLGYQKFLGLEVEIAGGHGVANPLIMDATVDQLDGYRFVYLLPFTPERVLIEDTRYSDGGDLDVAELERDIEAYAAARGWTVSQVVRREAGVLPIALGFDAKRFWADRPQDVATVGMRAGLFHPTTGYSLGEAVRVANLVADAWPVKSPELAARVRAHALDRARSQSFYRLLSRMLFKAAKPEQRRKILSHFYRLPQALVERFYAGRTTPADIARIFFGRPPVAVSKALPLVSERSFLAARP